MVDHITCPPWGSYNFSNMWIIFILLDIKIINIHIEKIYMRERERERERERGVIAFDLVIQLPTYGMPWKSYWLIMWWMELSSSIDFNFFDGNRCEGLVFWQYLKFWRNLGECGVCGVITYFIFKKIK